MVFFNTFTLKSSEEKLDQLIKIINDIYGTDQYNIEKKEDSLGEKRVIVRFRCYSQMPLINGLPELEVTEVKTPLENIEELVTYFSHKIKEIKFQRNTDVAMIYDGTVIPKCSDIDSLVKELVYRKLVFKGYKMDNGFWLLSPTTKDIVIQLGHYKNKELYIDQTHYYYTFNIDDGFTKRGAPISNFLQEKFLEWRAKKEFTLPVMNAVDITDFVSKPDEENLSQNEIPSECIRCKRGNLKTHSGISPAGIHYE